MHLEDRLKCILTVYKRIIVIHMKYLILILIVQSAFALNDNIMTSTQNNENEKRCYLEYEFKRNGCTNLCSNECVSVISEDSKILKSVKCVSPICCKAMTATCLACAAGLTPHEYCNLHSDTDGCKTGHTECCTDNTAECLSCEAGMNREMFCKINPELVVCK